MCLDDIQGELFCINKFKKDRAQLHRMCYFDPILTCCNQLFDGRVFCNDNAGKSNTCEFGLYYPFKRLSRLLQG